MRHNHFFSFSICLLLFSVMQATHATNHNPLLNDEQSKANTIVIDTTPPSSEKFGIKLRNKIKHLQQMRGSNYRPRTRHLTTAGKAKYTNRLFLESSPYLLQHAHNPVNWYPWGEDAFIAAAKLNRPIFLSVGYSTCHWCHVMEEESFEDLEIATFINENYIAIKVDREERPDIDAIYMAALHAMGQNGGWPMNVWLTPEKNPFYGGTYFPARDGDRGANTGLLTLLTKLKLIYAVQPDAIIATSQHLAEAIKNNLIPISGSNLPKPEIMNLAAAYYKSNADHFYGGTGNAPKFPSTTPHQFLLRYYRRTGDEDILNIVTLTLTKMAAGGIHDQIGGGFHRYAIDTEWLTPHFEKMLYDNALLSVDYLETYQLTKNEKFKSVANNILRYIQREMTSPEGGFYSATDADSVTPSGETEEGYYFTWSENEIIKIIGVNDYKIFKAYFATSKQGNFEGRNILNTPETIDTIVSTLNIDKSIIQKSISKSKKMLYQHRQTLIAPIRDEKIITAWNALMISAYAKAGFILNNKNYTQQALKSTQFIFDHLYKNGRLFRSYKDGQAKHNAYLDDYAFLIAALLDLYEVTFDIQWMNKAIELDHMLEAHFEDKNNGGYFMTSDDHEKLLSREKPNYDGAEPTGNSVQALNLLRLAEFTSNAHYLKRAENTLQSFSTILTTSPMSLSKMLIAVDFYYDQAKEIVIITPQKKENMGKENLKKSNQEKNILSRDFLTALQNQYLPNRVLSILSEGSDLKIQSNVISIAEDKIAINGLTTAYVCILGSCELPTNDAKVFAKQIRGNEFKKGSK